MHPVTRSRLADFLTDESGQDTVEYGLLAALIAIASIVTIQAIGPLVNDLYLGIQRAMAGGSAPGG